MGAVFHCFPLFAPFHPALARWDPKSILGSQVSKVQVASNFWSPGKGCKATFYTQTEREWQQKAVSWHVCVGSTREVDM